MNYNDSYLSAGDYAPCAYKTAIKNHCKSLLVFLVLQAKMHRNQFLIK